jgi:hypothetical protein
MLPWRALSRDGRFLRAFTLAAIEEAVEHEQMQLKLSAVALIVAALGVGGLVGYRVATSLPGVSGCRSGATALARLELLFGTARKDGSEVTEEEWRQFLDSEVTPRFPDGLTVLSGYGQWHASDTIAQESLRVLVIWYARGKQGEARIEDIRRAYKQRFDQESVMRVDGVSCVSF